MTVPLLSLRGSGLASDGGLQPLTPCAALVSVQHQAGPAPAAPPCPPERPAVTELGRQPPEQASTCPGRSLPPSGGLCSSGLSPRLPAASSWPFQQVVTAGQRGLGWERRDGGWELPCSLYGGQRSRLMEMVWPGCSAGSSRCPGPGIRTAGPGAGGVCLGEVEVDVGRPSQDWSRVWWARPGQQKEPVPLGPGRCSPEQCSCVGGRRRPDGLLAVGWGPPPGAHSARSSRRRFSNRNDSSAPQGALLGDPSGGCECSRALGHRQRGCGGPQGVWGDRRALADSRGLCLFPQSKSTGTWTSTR